MRAFLKSEELSIYHHGDSWLDLCRGPHLASSGKIGKAFKLTKVSGAYWRGDSNNEMLQRIYGTCWSSKEELKIYLNRLEEAEKRDHRKLGKRNGSYFILERKVLAQYFGMRKDGFYFKDLLSI